MTKARCLVLLLSLLAALGSKAVSSVCDVCGGGFDDGLYSITDEVDKQTKWLCDRCAGLETRCYRCGVPVWKDYLTLSDGRVVCPRDQVGILLDDGEALKVCGDVDGTLASILGRFTTFPSTNVEIRLADRVDVRALVGGSAG